MPKTLEDLTAAELLDLAMVEIRAAMANEGEEAGPACGAYAYLSVLQYKLQEQASAG